MPDLSNYYTKEEVDDKIIELSPLKTMTVEKTCSVQLEDNNGNNMEYYRASWFTEYNTLNPLSMTVKYKTITIKPGRSYPSMYSNIFHGTLYENYQGFSFNSNSQNEYSFEITDLNDLAVTRDNQTIFSVNLNRKDLYPTRYIAATVIVTVDLIIRYIV